ncbi:allophanate hydrolase-related protein [Amycolatopsis pithecellobii]|uniref:Allophanate hydrolase C-terminal domain-containing protein n=1 Tax=Amycolatopsis pithecellobii TaxID=664692 RepID=A0A6N7YHT8_9PSEU|nr:hypothetical protein [Amycolatopsis pithecellobii]MTD52455.1 hypothetical protein [Amycolatopsis pithecellobii]
MYTVDGLFSRPGLVHTGTGPADGIELEVWDLPGSAVGPLLAPTAEPRHLGPPALDDGSTVLGFMADSGCADPARDITGFSGRRSYLASGAGG